MINIRVENKIVIFHLKDKYKEKLKKYIPTTTAPTQRNDPKSLGHGLSAIITGPRAISYYNLINLPTSTTMKKYNRVVKLLFDYPCLQIIALFILFSFLNNITYEQYLHHLYHSYAQIKNHKR